MRPSATVISLQRHWFIDGQIIGGIVIILGGKVIPIAISLMFILSAFPAMSGNSDEVEGLRATGGLISASGPREGATTHIVKPGSISRSYPAPLPSAVNNSAGLPPIGDQGGEGSCTAWAIGYYHTTHNEWMERGIDVSDPQNQTSPAFLYNVANAGEDGGSYMQDVADIVISGGAPSMAEFPYVNGDYISWPEEDWIYTSGMQRKAVSQNWIDLTQPEGFKDAKARLSMGYTLTTGMYVWSNFDYIQNYKYTYCSSERYGTNRGGHIVCIVGYDDDFVTADGVGAFRMVNSWGTGWGQLGWWWMSYEAIVDGAIDPGWAMYLDSAVNYTPAMVARLQVEHPYRGDLLKGGAMQIVLTQNGTTVWSKTCFGPLMLESYTWSTYQKFPFPTGRFSVDISEALPYMSPNAGNFFSVDINNNDWTDGRINSFEILCPAWWSGNYSRTLPAPLPAFSWSANNATVYNGTFSHLPIRIDDDTDMRNQALGEFWEGKGTRDEPFVIHDYEIDGTSFGECVYVGNTTLHAKVSGCSLYNASGYNSSGVLLYSASNCSVDNCTMSYNYYGVSLVNSHDDTVTYNVAENCSFGMSLQSSNGNVLTHNVASRDGNGIILVASSGNTISNNTASYNSWRGIWLNTSDNNVILDNNASGNGLSLNGGWGYYLRSSDGNVLANNVASGNAWYCINLGQSNNNSIYHNRFYKYTSSAYDNGFNCWDNGYPSGGNYWSDYSGHDVFSGPAQNVSGSDGIGDVHYNIVGGANSDRYPLMAPWIPPTPLSHSHESPGINGVALNFTPVISVHVTDQLAMVNESSVRMYVNGYRILCDLTPIADGYNVTYWHEGGFAAGQTVRCRIFATDALGKSIDFTWNFTVPYSHTIALVAGWNLVSIPLATLSSDIRTVLSPISGLWDRAMAYNSSEVADPWIQYYVDWPASLNGLLRMDGKMGFWLNVTTPCNLTVFGARAATSIHLRAGWNLVGYPTLNAATTAGVAFWGTSADIVETFDGAAPYKTKVVGPNYVMRPGEGYWVHCVADSVWTVNW